MLWLKIIKHKCNKLIYIKNNNIIKIINIVIRLNYNLITFILIFINLINNFF